MTVQVIDIADAFAQTLRVTLGDQDCGIDIRQNSSGLYLSLRVLDAPIVTGVVCRDRTRIVRSAYLGFVGDLTFVDTQGTSDPSSPGLGTRFFLCYGTAEDF